MASRNTILFLAFAASLGSIANGFSVNSSTSNHRREFVKNAGATAAAVLLGQSVTVTSPLPAFAEEEEGFLVGGKPRMGDESIMSPKAYGTSAVPVQDSLRYGVPFKLANRIANYNRRFAEFGGYFQETNFESTIRDTFENNGGKPITFYDSNTGKPLFVAPINRSMDDFIAESKVHGWPSFRDQEVVWDSVRILRSSGETVSVDGTHLGHNLPDKRGNRYCINLVSIAGNPV